MILTNQLTNFIFSEFYKRKYHKEKEQDVSTDKDMKGVTKELDKIPWKNCKRHL